MAPLQAVTPNYSYCMWNEELVVCLSGCFDCTTLNILIDSCKDLCVEETLENKKAFHWGDMNCKTGD